MKYLLLMAALTLILPGNEKYIKQANTFIAKGDYIKAAAALDKVAADGRTDLFFLQQAALVFDTLRQFKQAISAYEQLVNEAEHKNAIVERITYLRSELAKSDAAEAQRLEKIKNCGKCEGTGYFSITEKCARCEGQGIVIKDCQRCYGYGTISCSKCGGTGKVDYTRPDGQTVAVTCSRCYGAQRFKCSSNCISGKVQEDCRKCEASGMATVRKQCDLHD